MSPLLTATARLVLPAMLVLGVFMLGRGHNAPGGGFIAGLIVAICVVLWMLASGAQQARELLRISPSWLVAGGLVIIAAAALAGPLTGAPLLTGTWSGIVVPVFGKLGSPILFDVGVFLAVVGVVLSVVFRMEEA